MIRNTTRPYNKAWIYFGLGYDAVYSGKWVPTCSSDIMFPYSTFHISSETLAPTFQNARYYNPEDYRLRKFKCYKLLLLGNVFRMTVEQRKLSV